MTPSIEITLTMIVLLMILSALVGMLYSDIEQTKIARNKLMDTGAEYKMHDSTTRTLIRFTISIILVIMVGLYILFSSIDVMYSEISNSFIDLSNSKVKDVK